MLSGYRLQQAQQKGRSYVEIVRGPLVSRVFSTHLSDGRLVAWVRSHHSSNDNAVRALAKSHASCNTCTSRASDLVRKSGPEGALLFQGEPPSQENCINELRRHAETTCKNPYQMVLVTKSTFPESKYTGPGGTQDYYHWTVVPDVMTSDDLVSRMSALWTKTTSSVEERLAKFLNPEARATMVLLDKIVKSGVLERSEYWASTCAWVLNLQNKFPTNYDKMTKEQKEELCVYAMATGNASGDVHYNFQTSANLIDFMTMTSEEAVAKEMDKRSDPRTNQVSQLARARQAKNVTSRYGIGLVWDGKVHLDDLDLHVRTQWGEVYFDRKILTYPGVSGPVAQLDLDAGISGNEAEPAENITFHEMVVGHLLRVYVNNFSPRSHGDVHCTVVVTQQGKEDLTYPVVWPKGRRSGDLLHVCSHSFTKVEEQPVEMSETEARAMEAQKKEFTELFGTPTSTVATLDDFSEVVCLKPLPVVTDALSELDTLTSKAKAKAKAGKSKVFLSQRLAAAPPATMEELYNRAGNGPMSVYVHLPDHVPGYVAKVEVESEQALHGGKTILSGCHYQDKFQPPLKPTKPGNARLDRSWVSHTRPDGTVAVTAVTKLGGKYFLFLEDAKLSEDPSFPHSAGFYPQDLSSVGHKHRSKWSYLNTAMKPKMPEGASVPAVGTFLTGDTATLFVDGKKLTLKV